MNMTKLIMFAKTTEGLGFKHVLDRKALQALAEKQGEIGRIFEALTKKAANPTVEVAVKSSKQGFVVGKAVVRDGERKIASGAVSISGLGTENVVIKEHGNVAGMFTSRGHVDTSKNFDLNELEYLMQSKGGKGKVGVAVGDALKLQAESDIEGYKTIKELTGIDVKDDVTRASGKMWQKVRDLFAGKDVKVKSSDLLKGEIKDISKVNLKDLKEIKDISKVNLKDLKEAISEVNLKDLKEIKDISKVNLKDLKEIKDISKVNLKDLKEIEGISKNISLSKQVLDYLKDLLRKFIN